MQGLACKAQVLLAKVAAQASEERSTRMRRHAACATAACLGEVSAATYVAYVMIHTGPTSVRAAQV